MRLLWYAGVSSLPHCPLPPANPVRDGLAARLCRPLLSPTSSQADRPFQSSAALAASVTAYAFNQRANFYSAMVYLSQNNLSLMVGAVPRPPRGPWDPFCPLRSGVLRCNG